MIFGRLLDLRDRLLNLWDRVATMPRRVFVYAALALAVPLPAFALTSGDAAPAPAALSISVSLDQCGLIETEVVCKLDASYGEIPGATSYTASVTRADGSVVDYGEVGGGATSLWVPYVGAGTYSVRIAAYGDPAQPGSRPELLSRDQSSTEGNAPESAPPSERTVEPGYVEPDAPRSLESSDEGAAEEQASESPAPECEEVQPPAEVPGDTDGDGVPDEAASGDTEGDESAEAPAAPLAGVPDATSAALEAEGDLPESIDCPGV